MAAYAQGRYKATIEKWGLGESAEKKTPEVFFVIIPQEFYDQTSGEWVPAPMSYERRLDMWITEKTIEFVSRDLMKLGYPHDTFDQLEPTHKDSHNFYGLEVEVYCKHEPYTGNDGQQKQGEKWSLAFDGGGTKVPESLDKKGTSKLNALFGKQLKQFRQQQRDLAPQKPSVVEPTNTEDDDEIPFDGSAKEVEEVL